MTDVIKITDADREIAQRFDRYLRGPNTQGNLRYAFAHHRTEAQADLLAALRAALSAANELGLSSATFPRVEIEAALAKASPASPASPTPEASTVSAFEARADGNGGER